MVMRSERPQGVPVSPDEQATALLALVGELVRELRPHDRQGPRVTLDSTLDRDLGLDSLSRVELLARLERAFGVQLSEEVFTTAETPRDLLRLVAGGAMPPLPHHHVQREVALAEASALPEEARTLIEMLEWHARAHPQRPHVYLRTEHGEERLSYADLLRGAQALAAGLQEAGFAARETAAIMLPTGRDYLFSFFGVLLAGGIPVPVYPPARPAQIGDHLRRHARILANAQASMLITVPEARQVGRLLKAHTEQLRRVATLEELYVQGARPAQPTIGPEDIALLQYTSGSTADPKGVVLTHRNLLANIRVMGEALQVDSTRDVFVSWLPMYHDLGLIGAWLGTLCHAVPLVLMSPLAFLARPSRWLWAIHEHRATLSAGPNFAYELCARKIPDEEIEGLDLSSWRMAGNGAEPVSPEALQAFGERFARYGFRADTMHPVYGLAEGTLGLAFSPLGRAPVIDRIRREPFTRGGRALPAAPGDEHALRYVGCGYALPGHEIRIVDAAGSEVGDRQEGRLQFRGPSSTSGYFRNPEATRKLFDDAWLEAGDLAYTVEGEIFITGRIKDMIIRGGRNVYPQELEEAVGDIPGVRRGCVAVFAANVPGAGGERLVVLAETREREPQAHEALRAQINAIAVDLIDMPPDDVVLAPPHTVLKTSSGKIRRAASRALYERGELGASAPPPWRQLARFAWTALGPQLHRGARLAVDLLYAAYVWALFILLAPLTFGLMALYPSPRWGWCVFGRAGRLLLWLSGTRLWIEGLDDVPPGPCVLVANHASYVDGLVLTAVLPRSFAFIAKRELAEQFVPRVLLNRMGVEYVERFDKRQGAEDARRIGQLLRGGRSLAFFPEGTFLRMPGLLPFRMGAFVAAAEAGVPVVPVALQGVRAKLRAEQWLPRRGPIGVYVGKALQPPGQDWSAAVKLRDEARAEILRHCGEPDLGSASVPV